MTICRSGLLQNCPIVTSVELFSGSTPTESLKQCWMNWSFPT